MIDIKKEISFCEKLINTYKKSLETVKDAKEISRLKKLIQEEQNNIELLKNNKIAL